MGARSPVHPQRSAQLAERAHAMRIAPSESEARLWSATSSWKWMADTTPAAAKRTRAVIAFSRGLGRVVRVDAELVMRDLQAAVVRVREVVTG